jgi:hypothetical protein
MRYDDTTTNILLRGTYQAFCRKGTSNTMPFIVRERVGLWLSVLVGGVWILSLSNEVLAWRWATAPSPAELHILKQGL